MFKERFSPEIEKIQSNNSSIETVLLVFEYRKTPFLIPAPIKGFCSEDYLQMIKAL